MPEHGHPGRSVVIGRIGSEAQPDHEAGLIDRIVGADLASVKIGPHGRLHHCGAIEGTEGTRIIRWGLHTFASTSDCLASIDRRDDGVTIRCDDAGVVPIYYTMDGNTVWFASEIAYLVLALDRRLHVDWDAWADIIQLGYPTGDSTPFVEIRRLTPAQELHWEHEGGGSLRSRAWSWTASEHTSVSREERAGAIIDSLRDSIAQIDAPVTLPLSGGWDSRLLLACAPPDQIRETVTVDTDSGRDRERRYAALVASARNVPHRQVGADYTRAYHVDAERAARLTGFQTSLHPWYLTLVDALADHAPVVDGLAGDVLLKGGMFATDEVVHAGTEDEAAAALWSSLAPARSPTPMVKPAVAGCLAASSRGRLGRIHGQFQGHPSAATLTIYSTRTLRGVSLAPTHLMAPVAPVLTPFTSAVVAQAALGLAPLERHGGDFYRLLLRRADPDLARLPSTNDRQGKQWPLRARRELHPRTQAWYRELLLRSEVRDLLSGGFVMRLEAGNTADLFASQREGYAARGLVLLSSWLRAHADHLVDVSLPTDWRPPDPRRARASTAGREQEESSAESPDDAWLAKVAETLGATRVLQLRWSALGLVGETTAVETGGAAWLEAALPVPDATMDLVLVADVLRFLDDPVALREELARVLAPGGILVVSSRWPVEGGPAPQPEEIRAWVASVAAPTRVSIRSGFVRIVGHRGGDVDLRGASVTSALTAELAATIDRLKTERRERRAERRTHEGPERTDGAHEHPDEAGATRGRRRMRSLVRGWRPGR